MSFFNKETKMSDLVFCSEQMPSIMNRFGLDFGFGESTVEETCKNASVSTDLFLTISEIYCKNVEKPIIKGLSSDEIMMIVKFLEKSHKYYNSYFFPKVHGLLHKILVGYNEEKSRIINKFFDIYQDEVFKHFDFEDKILFPYIEKLISSDYVIDKDEIFSIDSFTDVHSDIETQMLDLQNIIVKYLNHVEDEFGRLELLSHIHHVWKDLHCHSIIEEHLLLPNIKVSVVNE